MKTVGFFFLLLGASSWLLPMMGRQSLILSAFGAHERAAAAASLAVGVLLLLLGFRKKKSKDEKK